MADIVQKLPVKNDTRPEKNDWRPLQSLRHEVDRLFDAFENVSWQSSFPSTVLNFAPTDQGLPAPRPPAVDIAEKEKEYEITAELPGMNENDIELSFVNGGLLIRGQKQEAKEERKKDYFLSERQYGTFQRYFGLPEGVETDKIAATFKNGVLTVNLPKSVKLQASATKIAVKAA